MSSDTALVVEGVTKAWRSPSGTDRRVLDHVGFVVERGSSMCVTGGSGSGKTTLLHILAGLVNPDAGSVILGGQSLFTLGEAARDRFRARHIGYMFQVFNLVGMLSAMENVALPLVFAGESASSAQTRAGALLERLGLSGKSDHRPQALSVGEQQRVALARAVVAEPWLLLADEPTASLDPANAEMALELLASEASRTGASTVIVTHDPAVRARFALQLTVGGGT